MAKKTDEANAAWNLYLDYSKRLRAAFEAGDMMSLIPIMLERNEVRIHNRWVAECLCLVSRGTCRLIDGGPSHTILGNPAK